MRGTAGCGVAEAGGVSPQHPGTAVLLGGIVPRCRGAGWVTRRWDVGESDLLISFQDRDGGKLRGVAKGAKRSKKRFGGLLSPFLLIELEYFRVPGRDLVRIEGGSLIRYHASFYADLGKLLTGCCILEVVERAFPEGEGGPELFALLEEVFGWIESTPASTVPLCFFLLRSARLLGVEPELRACLHCRRPLGARGVFGFSVPQGGPVCGSCIGKGTATHRVSSETLALLRAWGAGSREDVRGHPHAGRMLEESEGVLKAFFVHHVLREFRSLGVLKRIRARQAVFRCG